MELTLLQLRDAAEICRRREQEKEVRAKEALMPELFTLVAGDAEDAKFRRITSPATLRDLNPVMHERMQQVCFFLAVTTPFGKRIVRIMVDYVVGEGLKFMAEDPAVQEVADRFWKDSINNMEENCEALFAELLIFGELCLPVAVNPVDGSVRLGYVDPQQIDTVEFGLMQTGSGQEVSIPVAVNLRKRIGEAAGRRLEIIRADEDPQSPTFGQPVGDCFYFAINKAKSASRGISELFSLADWIDVFDNLVFDFADRVRLLNSFVWHYVAKGADEATVNKLRDKVMKSPPRQGGIEVTNDQIDIEARTPDLKGADMSAAADVVKRYGMGGAGLPAWFFADPEGANRAVAEQMAGPTLKMLTNKQNVAKRMVATIMSYVVAQAVAHGVLKQGANLAWKIQVPDLSTNDISAAATAMQAGTGALAQAEDRGWIRPETAARGFQIFLQQIGVELDAEEFQKAQADKTERDAQQQDALNPQKNLADALKRMQALPAGRQAQGMMQ